MPVSERKPRPIMEFPPPFGDLQANRSLLENYVNGGERFKTLFERLYLLCTVTLAHQWHEFGTVFVHPMADEGVFGKTVRKLLLQYYLVTEITHSSFNAIAISQDNLGVLI